jgi:hypothetical protein
MKSSNATEPSARENNETHETGLPWPRTWRGVYIFVFAVFVLVVVALALFSRYFA